jgi:hypothetical protein
LSGIYFPYYLQGNFWFTFVSTIGIFIKDWAWYKENAMYRTNKKIRDARNKKKYWMAFGVFFFGVFTYLSITQSFQLGKNWILPIIPIYAKVSIHGFKCIITSA